MLSFPLSLLVDFPETGLKESENNQQVGESWVRDYLHRLNTYKAVESQRLHLSLLRELANAYVRSSSSIFERLWRAWGESQQLKKGIYQTCLQKRRGKMIWGTSGQSSLTLLPETIMACIHVEHIPCCVKEKVIGTASTIDHRWIRSETASYLVW